MQVGSNEVLRAGFFHKLLSILFIFFNKMTRRGKLFDVAYDFLRGLLGGIILVTLYFL